MLCQAQVLQFEEVTDAYDIAWNYLSATGAIKFPATAHEDILSSIISAYAQGQKNKIRLANKAITAFRQ